MKVECYKHSGNFYFFLKEIFALIFLSFFLLIFILGLFITPLFLIFTGGVLLPIFIIFRKARIRAKYIKEVGKYIVTESEVVLFDNTGKELRRVKYVSFFTISRSWGRRRDIVVGGYMDFLSNPLSAIQNGSLELCKIQDTEEVYRFMKANCKKNNLLI